MAHQSLKTGPLKNCRPTWVQPTYQLMSSDLLSNLESKTFYQRHSPQGYLRYDQSLDPEIISLSKTFVPSSCKEKSTISEFATQRPFTIPKPDTPLWCSRTIGCWIFWLAKTMIREVRVGVAEVAWVLMRERKSTRAVAISLWFHAYDMEWDIIVMGCRSRDHYEGRILKLVFLWESMSNYGDGTIVEFHILISRYWSSQSTSRSLQYNIQPSLSSYYLLNY